MTSPDSAGLPDPGSGWEGLGIPDLGEFFLEQMVVRPLAQFLASVTGRTPGEYEDLLGVIAEKNSIVTGILDWVLGLLGLDAVTDAIADFAEKLADAVDGLPLVGHPLSAFINGVADFVRATDTTATSAQATANTAQSTATTAQSTASTANTNATSAQGTANTAQSTATGAQQVGADNSAAISEIQSTLSGQVGASGFTYAYPFDGSALDSNWTTYDPMGIGLVVAGGQIEPGNAATGNIFHLMETALPGDDFETSFTLGDPNNHGTEATGLLFAANDTLTDFGRIYTFDHKIYLGRSTRPSSSSDVVTTYDWASNTSLPADFVYGSNCRVRKVGNNYKVWVGTVQVFNHNNTAGDPGGVKTTGALYRYLGIQQEYDGALFHGRSAGVAHFTVADYTAPTYTGTGWRLIRAATTDTGTSTWSTAGAAVNASTFDITDRVHGNATVDNLGLGRVRVTQSGTYDIEVQVEFAGGTALPDRWVGVLVGSASPPTTLGGRSPSTPGALSMGGSVGTTGSAHTHPGISSSGSHSHSDTFAVTGEGGRRIKFHGKVWLNANDYVQVVGGTEASTASVGTRGDAAGTKTFFAGFRLG